jgi:hypothetical protein
MGNSSSTHPNNSNSPTSNFNSNHNHINNIALQQEPLDLAPMISDVDIAFIRQHLKSGKPSKEFKVSGGIFACIIALTYTRVFLSNESQFLENEDLDEDETIEAQKLYNREKNRYTNILPCMYQLPMRDGRG